MHTQKTDFDFFSSAQFRRKKTIAAGKQISFSRFEKGDVKTEI